MGFKKKGRFRKEEKESRRDPNKTRAPPYQEGQSEKEKNRGERGDKGTLWGY